MNKKIKFTLAGILLLTVYLVPAAHAQHSQPALFSFNGIYLVPANDNIWEPAFGAEAKVMLWANDNFGVALAGGYQHWQATENIVDSIIRKLDGGTAGMIPVGASLLFRTDLGWYASLKAEAGVRYVVVNSDINVAYTRADITGRGIIVSEGVAKVDIGDGIVGLIGADFHLTSMSVFAGAGYQFDVVQGEATAERARLKFDNELSGFFVRAGFAW